MYRVRNDGPRSRASSHRREQLVLWFEIIGVMAILAPKRRRGLNHKQTPCWETPGSVTGDNVAQGRIGNANQGFRFQLAWNHWAP